MRNSLIRVLKLCQSDHFLSIHRGKVLCLSKNGLHFSNPRYEDDTFVVKSKFKDVSLSEQSFFDYVWSNRDKHASRLALVDGISEQSLTYAEAFRQSKNFALNLINNGAEKGQVLAMFLPNSVEFPLFFAGTTGAGMVVTTMNPLYTTTEIAKQLKMSKAAWAITTPELLPTFREAVSKLDNKESWEGRILVTGDNAPGVPAMNYLNNDIEGYPEIKCDVFNDICVLPFSSGTTGVPKGVMLTHFNMVANVCQGVLGPPEMQLMPEATDNFQPVTVCALPLYHAFAMNVTMTPTLWCGGKLVIMPKFDPKGFSKALEVHKPTFMHLAPPLVSFIADSKEITADVHLSRLNHILVAAAPSGPALIKKFKDKSPNCVYREGWGMSETSPLVHVTPLNDEVNGCCGLLLPNTEAKVVDLNTGKSLGPGERGELCIRGPQNMKGYLDNPEATSSTLRENWLYSGDIAIYDKEGRFAIVDRLKELIKVKGFQVPPAELENLLRGHAKVKDVAVIGIPHEKFGEAPRAYIVKADSTLTDKDLLDFVAENAAPYKQLIGGIEFMEAIPKSAAGKILRKELLAKYKSENNL